VLTVSPNSEHTNYTIIHRNKEVYLRYSACTVVDWTYPQLM